MKYFKISNKEIINTSESMNVIWGEEDFSYGISNKNLTNPYIEIQFNDLPQNYKNNLNSILHAYRENIYKTLDEKIEYKKQYFRIESRNILAIFNESKKIDLLFELIENQDINIYYLEDNVEKHMTIPKDEALQEYKKYITYTISLSNNFIDFKTEIESISFKEEIDKKLNQFMENNKLV